MKNKFLTIVLPCFFLFLVRQSHAVTTTLPSHISEVTVYADRARVTRSAEVSFEPGENIIEFINLPAALEDNSLRTAGSSIPGVQLESMEVRPVEPLLMEINTQPLEQEIESLNDQLRVIDDEREALNQRREYLQALSEKMAGLVVPIGSSNLVSVTTIKSYYDLYGEESIRLSEKLRELDQKERNQRRIIETKQKELAKQRNSQPSTTKKAIVIFSVEKAVKGTLRLSYLMMGAQWQPLYDVRSESGTESVELKYYANVWQNTGENWDNVQLTLSTARPNIGARPAELEPWIVCTENPVSSRSYSDMDAIKSLPNASYHRRDNGLQNSFPQNAAVNSQVADEAAETPTIASSESKPEMALRLAEIESLGASASFRVPATASIPSDGLPHRSTIGIVAMKTTPEYVTTPKQMPLAFLKSKVKNNTQFPLLPGDISLFSGDDFIGKSFLKLVAPGAAFDLYLGQDDSVKITRKETKKRTDQGGLLVRRQLLMRGYEITVENFKDKPTTVTVTEPLPVSQQSELQVNPFWISGSPTRFDADSGKAEWSFTLKPHERRVITYEFEVSSEPGINVAGL